MTVWILAVLLIAGMLYVGYAQGAIRVAFSLFGILVGWIAAVPLSGKVAPFFKKMGFDDPVTPTLFGGLLVFILVSAAFKSAALLVHRKVETYFKYRVGETHLLIWEHMNRRVGACLGVGNAVLYLILISGLVYGLGYWTIQMARSEGDPFTLRVVNNAARGLASSGFVRTAGAVVPLGESYYDAADLAGLLYNNTAAEERLATYPAFLSFAERLEFKEIGRNEEIRAMRQNGESLTKFMAHPLIQNVVTNRELRGELEAVVSRDLKDLTEYIRTGRSKKYEEEKILGHWTFGMNDTLAQVRVTRPDITSKDMAALRLLWRANYSQARLVMAPDRQVFFKGIPDSGASTTPGPVPELRTLKGQWEEAGGGYRMTFEGESGEVRAVLQERSLILHRAGMVLAFNREFSR